MRALCALRAFRVHGFEQVGVWLGQRIGARRNFDAGSGWLWVRAPRRRSATIFLVEASSGIGREGVDELRQLELFRRGERTEGQKQAGESGQSDTQDVCPGTVVTERLGNPTTMSAWMRAEARERESELLCCRPVRNVALPHALQPL